MFLHSAVECKLDFDRHLNVKMMMMRIHTDIQMIFFQDSPGLAKTKFQGFPGLKNPFIQDFPGIVPFKTLVARGQKVHIQNWLSVYRH